MRWINTSKMVEEDVHCTLPRERESAGEMERVHCGSSTTTLISL